FGFLDDGLQLRRDVRKRRTVGNVIITDTMDRRDLARDRHSRVQHLLHERRAVLEVDDADLHDSVLLLVESSGLCIKYDGGHFFSLILCFMVSATVSSGFSSISSAGTSY